MSIKSDIQYYFEHHPNEKIYLKDLQQDENFKEVNARTLQTTISTLIQTGYNLNTVDRGQCWLYVPVAKEAPTNSNMELKIVGRTKKGTLICEDFEGVLWRATVIE